MKKILSTPQQFAKKPFRWFKRLSFKKKALVLVLLFVAIIIGLQRINSLTKSPAYTLDTAQRSDLTEIVSETGTVSVNGKTDIYSPSDGIVVATFVENGMSVVEGQELFQVESAATEQEQQAAYANYLAAVASFDAAQSNANILRADMYAKWKTYTDIATNSTYENSDDTPNTQQREAAEFQIAQDSWLAAEKKFKDQQTAIAQASAQANSTWLTYQATQDAVVKAPFSGVVSNLAISEGNGVKAKSPAALTPQTPALVLSNSPSSTEITIELGETDIAKVHPGQRATVDINAVSNKQYKAVVTRVDEIGTNVDGVVSYNVYLSLLNPDNQIRPGMSVDAEIVTKELADVLTVPNSAVKPYQGGRAVRIPDTSSKDGFRYVPVVIGIRGDERTEVLEGLTEGQEIITALANDQIRQSGFFGN